MQLTRAEKNTIDEPLEECKQCRAWNQQDDYSLYWEQ